MWIVGTHLVQAKPEDTLDLCKLLNDDLAATVAKHPGRFTALGTLPMQAPKLAVQELTRCVKVSIHTWSACSWSMWYALGTGFPWS